MKKYCLLLLVLFSLSCYSQESLKIDVSISRAKKGLVVKFKNEGDTLFVVRNGDGMKNPVLWEGTYAYIKTDNDGIYGDNKAYWPLLPETGEVWYKKEHKISSFIRPKQEVTMDILGINEELLKRNKLYVKLALPLHMRKGTKEVRFKCLIIEQWVPVE